MQTMWKFKGAGGLKLIVSRETKLLLRFYNTMSCNSCLMVFYSAWDMYRARAVCTVEMKGTKVLTLGAGREVLPHNMAVTMRMTYIHAL